MSLRAPIGASFTYLCLEFASRTFDKQIRLLEVEIGRSRRSRMEPHQASGQHSDGSHRQRPNA